MEVSWGRSAGLWLTFQLVGGRMPRHSSTNTENMLLALFYSMLELAYDCPLYGWAIIAGVLYFFGVFTLVKNFVLSVRQSAVDYANSFSTASAGSNGQQGQKKSAPVKIKRFMFVREDGTPLHSINLGRPAEEQQQ